MLQALAKLEHSQIILIEFLAAVLNRVDAMIADDSDEVSKEIVLCYQVPRDRKVQNFCVKNDFHTTIHIILGAHFKLLTFFNNFNL